MVNLLAINYFIDFKSIIDVKWLFNIWFFMWFCFCFIFRIGFMES